MGVAEEERDKRYPGQIGIVSEDFEIKRREWVAGFHACEEKHAPTLAAAVSVLDAVYAIGDEHLLDGDWTIDGYRLVALREAVHAILHPMGKQGGTSPELPGG